MEKALITGITGQDGAYFDELLLSKDCEVQGAKRRISLFYSERIDHLHKDSHKFKTNLCLNYGNLTDSLNLTKIDQKIQYDEIYNLEAHSRVAGSMEQHEYTANYNGIGTLKVCGVQRLKSIKNKVRINQAFPSGPFGKIQKIPLKRIFWN